MNYWENLIGYAMWNKRFNSIMRIIFLALLALSALDADAKEKKNLLFIMTDQQRYDALSIAGNTVLETPNLDRLAQQ